MYIYKVTRWDVSPTQFKVVTAADSRGAAKATGFATPGANITVDGPDNTTIRYIVSKTGKLMQKSTYSAPSR